MPAWQFLHDDQEQVRLQQLAGITGFLNVPQHRLCGCTRRQVAIGPEHFPPSRYPRPAPGLRFKSSPVADAGGGQPDQAMPSAKAAGQ